MEKRSEYHFKYPPNIHELDLATMVSMYRSRGEPRQAAPGKYLACSVSRNLLKEGKWWFGLYYSQKTWDSLLTNGSGGYPLTESELNVMGLVLASSDDYSHREYVEKNSGAIPKLAYLIVNDLKQFAFLSEDQNGFLSVTPLGEKALQGICRRIYGKRFVPEMLSGLHAGPGDDSVAGSSDPNEQTSLF
ncbi:MAG: hypothetical protein WEC12_04815 [Balneolaceae bacterium]